MKPVTPADVWILFRTVAGEGRGETDIGRLAIAYTPINRAKKYGWSVAEACLKSVHYSCWNNAAWNDANQLRMLTGDLDDKAFARCMISTLQAIHGLVEDPTGNATHYHTHDTLPGWAVDQDGKRKHYTSIGGHAFYRNVD